MLTHYKINSPYPYPEEQPPADVAGLFLESIPVFKLWYEAPVDVEYACLKGVCTHIGLIPPLRFPGSLPIFLFRDTVGQSLLLRAPLAAAQEQVRTWASGDSNAFTFVLIERGPAIIRQIRTIGIPEDFRRYLATAWMSIAHPVDMLRCNALLSDMNDQDIIEAAMFWVYNPETDNFEKPRTLI